MKFYCYTMFSAYLTGIFLPVVLILTNAPDSLSIRCYKCSSKENPDECGSDFKLTSKNTSFIVDNCDTCHKTVIKETHEIKRNCSLKGTTSFKITFGCKTKTINDHLTEYCSCSKELCNGNQHHRNNIIVFLCSVMFSLLCLLN